MSAWRSKAAARGSFSAASAGWCRLPKKSWRRWNTSSDLRRYSSMASLTVTHERASIFYDRFARKGELQHQTHYCPGCGHGITPKILAEALEHRGVRDRTVLVSPVGCSVFAYYYFDVGNGQAAHGRPPAVATAVKRSRPESIVVAYQGDGDLAAIGTAEIIHAAN